jgi:DNA-directed RNA polymerase I, II, and III subunit RPABC1
MTLETQAIKVLYEMILDRGYVIDYIDYLNTESYCIKGTKNNVENINSNTILCFINADDKLNIQGIKDRISIMNKEGSTKCIIVYRSSVTSSAKKSLETLEYDFELFGLHELQLNITRHRLVPRHERVLLSEKEELDRNYKGKIPTILQTDPVSRYYAFERGEYIRITRKDGTMIYRIVK